MEKRLANGVLYAAARREHTEILELAERMLQHIEEEAGGNQLNLFD
jgi:hypothetical protein